MKKKTPLFVKILPTLVLLFMLPLLHHIGFIQCGNDTPSAPDTSCWGSLSQDQYTSTTNCEGTQAPLGYYYLNTTTLCTQDDQTDQCNSCSASNTCAWTIFKS
jgi:hypothetical protein